MKHLEEDAQRRREATRILAKLRLAISEASQAAEMASDATSLACSATKRLREIIKLIESGGES